MSIRWTGGIHGHASLWSSPAHVWCTLSLLCLLCGAEKFLENLLHTENIFFHFLDIILTYREQRIYYVTRTTRRALMHEHTLAFLYTHVILLFEI